MNYFNSYRNDKKQNNVENILILINKCTIELFSLDKCSKTQVEIINKLVDRHLQFIIINFILE